MAMRTAIPPALAEIAAGRDYIKTREFSKALNKAVQTVRKLHCLTGEAYGVRPIKVGNGLNWSVVQTAVLLNGGAK
jgi:hypothetical protein